jgi:hypothetical protein
MLKKKEIEQAWSNGDFEALISLLTEEGLMSAGCPTCNPQSAAMEIVFNLITKKEIFNE